METTSGFGISNYQTPFLLLVSFYFLIQIPSKIKGDRYGLLFCQDILVRLIRFFYNLIKHFDLDPAVFSATC